MGMKALELILCILGSLWKVRRLLNQHPCHLRQQLSGNLHKDKTTTTSENDTALLRPSAALLGFAACLPIHSDHYVFIFSN
mmetsp:Transcript_4600/g.9661  ORF Transcript_4600/g.9661 Transcript_4600/m.9661 type:complete len:81 (-) Transcript_4600:159-401(-)